MSTLMPVQDDSLSNKKEEILKAHNEARQEVNVDPLEWSDEMESLAQEWADRLAQTGKLKHRPLKGRFGTKKGENIAYFTKEKKILDGIKLWLMEKKYYVKRTGGCRGDRCGHYKQIVWKTTEKVGCASAQSDEGQTIIVCNYDPGGNYQGEKAY